MPVIDFFGFLLMLAFALGVIVLFVVVFGGAAFWIFCFCLLTGWFPILMCATDASYSITWDAQSRDTFGTLLVQRWAYLSMLIYLGMSALTVIVSFVRPDPDGLPPGLKFLALFSVPDAVAASATARGLDGPSLYETGFFETARNFTGSIFGARLEARAMKKAAEAVKVDAERMRAAEELATAHEELERLRAREKKWKEFIKKDE